VWGGEREGYVRKKEERIGEEEGGKMCVEERGKDM
jgi:hypothetical protein